MQEIVLPAGHPPQLLESVLVSPGDACKAGQTVARLGEKGEMAMTVPAPGYVLAAAAPGLLVNGAREVVVILGDVFDDEAAERARQAIARSWRLPQPEGEPEQEDEGNIGPLEPQPGRPQILATTEARVRIERLCLDPVEMIAALKRKGIISEGMGSPKLTQRHVDAYLGLGKKLAIVGAGEDGAVTLDLLRGRQDFRDREFVVYDVSDRYVGHDVAGVQIRGMLEDLCREAFDGGIGSIVLALRGAPRVAAFEELYRQALPVFMLPLVGAWARVAPSASLGMASLIDDHASIGSSVSVGANGVVGAGSVIGSFAKLGENCQVGVGCTVGPGAILEDLVTLGPGVVVGPGIRIEKGIDVPAGSVIVKNLKRGDTP